jgi:hypothetical protein
MIISPFVCFDSWWWLRLEGHSPNHRVVKQLTLSVSAKRRGSHMVGTAGQVILNTRESDDHTGRAGLMITCGFEESLDLSKRHTGAWTIYARL